MKIIVKTFFLILLLFPACDEDDRDYRNKFTGEYNFTVIHAHNTFIGDPTDGHFESYSDTSEYTGSIKKSVLHFNQINVDWGTGEVYTEDGIYIDRNKTVLEVDEDGNLECPGISEGFFSPRYIHGDTICFTFYAGQGMAHMLYSEWIVLGLKDDY